MNIKSPILYCCYNRLDLIKKSIQIIKNINCKKIYIAVDGPKDIEKDRKNNIEIKNFIKQDLLSSDVEILFREKNLGCKKAISESINWFFRNEERGIILEEDLYPADSFFKFCDYALEKYEIKKK